MKKNNKYELELYFKNLKIKHDYETIKKEVEKNNLELRKFEEVCNDELTDLEKRIINTHHLEGKSLKKISLDTGYSYSYIRKVYVEAKEKMRIIMSVSIKHKES